MPENKKPWYCRPCDAWCHSDMDACPKCIKKETLSFPQGSANPGASEMGPGGPEDVREREARKKRLCNGGGGKGGR
jgi:hypothetical protein